MPDVLEFSDPSEAVDHIVSKTPRLSITDLREEMEKLGILTRLGPVSSSRVSCDVYAVDSAFPSTPVSLVGYSMSVVAVAAVYWCNASVKMKRWLIIERLKDLDQDYVVAFAREQERRLALGLDSKSIVLDGELVPRQGRNPLWREVKQMSLELVDKVLKARGVIAGVLKRSYSRRLSLLLGVNLTDKAIASLVLYPGEAIVLPHSSKDLVGKGCVEAFYRPLRGVSPAVKVEACCSSREECLRFIAMLAWEAGPSGFPWALDLVDSMVKRGVGIIDSIENLLLSRLARSRLTEVALSSNPQERRPRSGR